MDFDNTIVLLKKGAALRRRAWSSGEDVLRVVYVDPRYIDGTTENLEIHTARTNKDIATIYSFTTEDIFSTDWEVVEARATFRELSDSVVEVDTEIEEEEDVDGNAHNENSEDSTKDSPTKENPNEPKDVSSILKKQLDK